MLWTLPRSADPGALTCHAHTSARFTRSENAPLPYGSVARMLLAWVYAEAGRTGDQLLHFGPSFRRFVTALDIAPEALYDQMRRLFGCSVHTVHGKSRLAQWFIFVWPHGPQGSPFPKPDSVVLLGEAIWPDVRSHPIALTPEPLRALAHTPLGLDLHLWELYHRAQHGRPRTVTWLRLYHELAEHPSARATDAEVSAFLREAGEALGDGRRLAGLLSTPPCVDAACGGTAFSACEERQR